MTLTSDYIRALIQQAFAEDIGEQDVTAQLIPEDKHVQAKIIAKEPAVMCGLAFVKEAFLSLDPDVQVSCFVQDKDQVEDGQCIVEIKGNARSLMSAERTALNFLQLLSGTATTVSHYVAKLAGTKTKLLDTRKTIPGLRLAQKYAVACGGGVNHRIGLFDAFLIKENHIAACGGISQAVAQARALHPDIFLEVEVENDRELEQALAAKVDRIMLDNFTLEEMRLAVAKVQGAIPLEVSGNVTLETMADIAQTGVDFISVGGITKHVRAIDFSMRVI